MGERYEQQMHRRRNSNKYIYIYIYMFNLTNNQDNIILIVKYQIDVKSYLPKYDICRS